MQPAARHGTHLPVAELAEAVWRVIRRDGLEHASVRNVAREAGLSMGSLRHYFSTQSELLIFALRLVIERIDRRLATLHPDAEPRQAAERFLPSYCRLMPTGGRRTRSGSPTPRVPRSTPRCGRCETRGTTCCAMRACAGRKPSPVPELTTNWRPTGSSHCSTGWRYTSPCAPSRRRRTGCAQS